MRSRIYNNMEKTQFPVYPSYLVISLILNYENKLSSYCTHTGNSNLLSQGIVQPTKLLTEEVVQDSDRWHISIYSLVIIFLIYSRLKRLSQHSTQDQCALICINRNHARPNTCDYTNTNWANWYHPTAQSVLTFAKCFNNIYKLFWASTWASLRKKCINLVYTRPLPCIYQGLASAFWKLMEIPVYWHQRRKLLFPDHRKLPNAQV